MGMANMSPTPADYYSSHSSSGSTATTESGATQLPAAAAPRSAVADVSPADKAVTSRAAAPAQGSSRYKGVVPQPNRRWGAQIYERHSRVWLGTFADEETAARAYDVAALRYRGRGAEMNFRVAEVSAPELAFLAAHSKEEIIDMLRKHTYTDELRLSQRRSHGMGVRAQPTPAWAREPLFEKAVTPSDVGKLNRLVVPKQHAEKHFPLKHTRETAATDKGVLLNLEDGEGKVWRFRYSYWHSSQSYVLTKGWSRFVREKGLRSGDTVVFSRLAYGPEKQLLIDFKKKKIDAAYAPAVVRLFGVNIAGDGCHCQKRGRPVEIVALEQGKEILKKQCVGVAHQHAPALGAFQ